MEKPMPNKNLNTPKTPWAYIRLQHLIFGVN